ncbi:MAG: glycerol-3-phosphate 1-O-acyltransferase PlsY [Opitutales bacterium]|nr:glycerol-3-phosphate 1-O-acyltransferase PlsY [Opitutales bacterium]
MLGSFLLGYLLGALPFGVWIANMHGVCIFQVGSGSPGATNVLRTVGKGAGYTVFVLDALKGTLAVFLGLQWQSPYVALAGTLLGHSYSCFLHFKGGKGVASLIGGLLVLIPLPLLSGLVVWLLIFKTSRYVSCASIGFAFSLLPFCCLYEGISAARFHALPLFLLSLWVLFRHRANLVRLWQGNENRF